MNEDFISENEEAENYANHFDDAIEAFTKYVDQVIKVHISLKNVIQHSGRKFEVRLDEIYDILGSKSSCLEKALYPPNI